MKKLIPFLFLSLALGIPGFSQQEETVFNRHGGIRLTGIWGGSYNSIADFEDNFNLVNGGFFSFEINNELLLGFSGYDSDITTDGRNIEINGKDLFIGYVFNSKQVIHPLFYLQGGSSRLEVEDVGSDKVFMVQPTLGAEINIARFFKIGIDGGYRFFNNVDLNGFSDKDFSGPILGIRLKFGWSWGSD